MDPDLFKSDLYHQVNLETNHTYNTHLFTTIPGQAFNWTTMRRQAYTRVKDFQSDLKNLLAIGLM